VVADHRPVRLCVSDNPEDSRSYSVSFEKIRKALGFEAEISIEEGIRELVQHFASGTYQDFRTPMYSNVATTRQILHEFYDSAELSGHGPLRTE
jgi:dTDP-D-glucose 4,6-dehydratase